MPSVELIRSFLERADAQGSRSTVLTPLGWLTAMLLSGFIAVLIIQAPLWATTSIGITLGVCVFLYLAAYTYFAFKNPELLRSEKFTLSKMAIERSITGDNLSGLVDPASQRQALQLRPSTTEKTGE
jgi:hypothetical protein